MFDSTKIREDIIKRLIYLDLDLKHKYNNLNKRFRLIIVGGSAIALKHELTRTTEDIDSITLEKELEDFLQENYEYYRINNDCKDVILLHPDYETRLMQIKIDYQFKFLDIYILSDYDIIITKLGRGNPRDLKDIKESGILNLVNEKILDRLVNEAIDYHTIGENRLRAEWKFFKRELFEEVG